MSKVSYVVPPQEDGVSHVNIGGEVYPVGATIPVPKALVAEAIAQGKIVEAEEAESPVELDEEDEFIPEVLEEPVEKPKKKSSRKKTAPKE